MDTEHPSTCLRERDLSYAAVVGIQKCKGVAHLQSVMKEVLKHNGEGIMLREPRSSVRHPNHTRTPTVYVPTLPSRRLQCQYEHKRSKVLLKVKHFYDEEALVTGTL